jgi:hypothetical protein
VSPYRLDHCVRNKSGSFAMFAQSTASHRGVSSLVDYLVARPVGKRSGIDSGSSYLVCLLLR